MDDLYLETSGMNICSLYYPAKAWRVIELLLAATKQRVDEVIYGVLN